MTSLPLTLTVAATALREALRNPDILRLQASWVAGIAADWAFLVVVLVIAYDVGGAVTVGLVGAIRMLPATAVALFATVSARQRQERVLVAIGIVRAAAVAVAVVSLALDASDVLVFLAAAVVAGAGGLVRPLHMALLPALARSPDELVASNVATSTGEGLATFVGPVAGGVLLALAGPSAAAAAVSLGFAAAAAGVWLIRMPDAARTPPPAERERAVPVLAGIATLRARPSAAVIVLAFFGQVFVRGLLTTLLVIVAIELLGLGEAGVGWLNGAFGVGGLAGGIAAMSLARARLGLAFAIALVGWGAPIALMGAQPMVAVALTALVVVGVSNAVLDVAGFTLLQRSIPAQGRLAVLMTLEAAIGVGVSVGGLVAPVLVAATGVRGALIVTGVILPLVALATWPRVRAIERDVVIPDRELRLLRGIPMFALLPLTALERLASSLTPVTLAPGETLTREGEEGDAFFILAEGRVEVRQVGRLLRESGPGEGIGEIALLRRIPRTATVTCLEPVLAYALDRNAFVEAVTGHPGSAATADALVAERLAPERA